jgi:hypothetical protein
MDGFAETNWGHLEHGRLSSAQRTLADEMARLIQRNLGTDGKAAVNISSDADAIYVDVLHLLVPCAPNFRGINIGYNMGQKYGGAMVKAERQPAVAKSGQGFLLALREEGLNHKKQSVLLGAALDYGRYREVFRALLEAGADCDTKDSEGFTALMRMALQGHTEAIRLLLEAGAEVNATGKGGQTALIMAAMEGYTEIGYTEITRLLLEAGAEVNATDKNGETALMWAARRGQTEAAALLREAGAEVDATNKNGETALTQATSRGKTETAALLRAKGATD